MCVNPITKSFPPSVHERYLGIQSPRTLTLPCGKCSECLKKRQNDLATRVYLEALKRGSMCFVTLTYDPKNVPIAQSHWIAERDTGEYTCVAFPEVIPSGERLDIYRADVVDFHRQSNDVYCKDFPIPELSRYDEQYDHFVRVTPTLYYEDVKNCFKRFRNKCDKEFSYCAVGEYGKSEFGKKRPHYHVCLFGLGYDDAKLFADQWHLGFSQVKQVNFVNKDGSNGLQKVSRYVGKYCSKGVFDIYTQRQKCVLSNRLRSSKGFGSYVNADWFLAKDFYKYDINNPCKNLNKEQIEKLVDRIISRSFIDVNGYKFPLPSAVIRKIYGYQRTDTDKFKVPELYSFGSVQVQEKAIYAPIYYMVASELRSRSEALHNREFEQFTAKYSPKDISKAVMEFNRLQEISYQSRESAATESILKFYQKKSKL